MSKEGRSIKVNAIVSSVPPIAFFTLGIYPFVVAIMLFVNSDQFKNKGLSYCYRGFNVICFTNNSFCSPNPCLLLKIRINICS